jgi:SAM-dependent methyltransferase
LPQWETIGSVIANGMKTVDSQTLAFYAAEAPVYTSSRPDGISRHLTGFLERLPIGGSILELGCGGGIDAAHMIARGFAVEPTDGVPEIAKQAEARLGFAELADTEKYDAVVANAALLHVPREGLAAILAKIWCSLKRGGWHLASYKGGGTEGRDDHGRYYNYLSRADAEAYYCAAGDWSALEFEESIGGGYFGTVGPWIKVSARKA